MQIITETLANRPRRMSDVAPDLDGDTLTIYDGPRGGNYSTVVLNDPDFTVIDVSIRGGARYQIAGTFYYLDGARVTARRITDDLAARLDAARYPVHPDFARVTPTLAHLRALTGRIDWEATREDLHWAYQWLLSPRDDQPADLTARAVAAVEAATGLPAADGAALIREHNQARNAWDRELNDLARNLPTWARDAGINGGDVHAYARAYLIPPSEALTHVAALPKEERGRWFFGFYRTPAVIAIT